MKNPENLYICIYTVYMKFLKSCIYTCLYDIWTPLHPENLYICIYTVYMKFFIALLYPWNLISLEFGTRTLSSAFALKDQAISNYY